MDNGGTPIAVNARSPPWKGKVIGNPLNKCSYIFNPDSPYFNRCKLGLPHPNIISAIGLAFLTVSIATHLGVLSALLPPRRNFYRPQAGLQRRKSEH